MKKEGKATSIFDVSKGKHYHLVIDFPKEGRIIIHNPERDYVENDTRGWLDILLAVKELRGLKDVRVDEIFQRHNIRYEEPSK